MVGKRTLKHWLLVLLACGAFVSTTQAETQILDRVAAIVDDDVVMESELQSRLDMVVTNAKASGAVIPSDLDLRREVLDRLIVESLQMQMAVRAGVQIDDNTLNRSMQGIAQQNGMDLQTFIAQLESTGESYEGVREQVRRDMVLQRVQRGNVNHRVQITEDEVDNFLDSVEGKQLTAVAYHLDHLLLPLAGDASSDDEAAALTAAQQIQARASEGESLQELATAFVQQKASYSDLGWRNEGQLPSIFKDVAPSLATAAVAEPIRSPSGWHVIKLVERRGNEPQIISQTEVRHILLKPSEVRDDQQTKEELDAILQKIRNGADFAQMAKQYSEDIGSAAQGGELGWMAAGELVPAFEDMMHQTPVDGISESFQSQFGWHVLQVTGRREHDISDAVLRNRVRNIIHERKYGEELEIWLQKIRDEAYVDIK